MLLGIRIGSLQVKSKKKKKILVAKSLKKHVGPMQKFFEWKNLIWIFQIFKWDFIIKIFFWTLKYCYYL